MFFASLRTMRVPIVRVTRASGRTDLEKYDAAPHVKT
jgi:hypothetical protein